jgi:hypothetical protein
MWHIAATFDSLSLFASIRVYSRTNSFVPAAERASLFSIAPFAVESLTGAPA